MNGTTMEKNGEKGGMYFGKKKGCAGEAIDQADPQTLGHWYYQLEVYLLSGANEKGRRRRGSLSVRGESIWRWTLSPFS